MAGVLSAAAAVTQAFSATIAPRSIALRSASWKAWATVLALRMASASSPSPPASPASAASASRSARPFGVHVEHPLGELRHLGDATSNRYPFDRVAAQIFQHAADEIPHVDQRGLGQFIQRLSRFFRGVPGSAEHVSAAGRTRHVNASPDGVDPGRAGKRDNDARGAENGDTPENAESAVEGFSASFSPSRTEISTSKSVSAPATS